MGQNIRVVSFRLCAVFFITTLFSCIDSKYNLDDVSNKMHLFDNGIDFPLLDTGDVPFSRLLNEDDDVKVDQRGVYSVYSDPGQLVSEFDVVGVITLPGQQPSFGEGRSFQVEVSWPQGTERVIPFPQGLADFTARLTSESGVVDDKIVDVKSASTEKVHDAMLSFKVFDGNGSPLRDVAITQIIFNNYRLQLPSQLIIPGYENNVITLNGTYDYNNFKVTVPVKGLKNISVQNRRIKIDEVLSIGGGFSCRVKNLSAGGAVQTMMLKPYFEVPDMNINSIYGRADVKVDPINETLRVGNIPSFLTDNDTKLVLTNPILVLQLKNSVTMPFTASMTIKPKDAAGRYIKGDDGQPIIIKVPAIQIGGAGVLKKYIAREEVKYYNDLGYEFIRCNDLYKLGLQVPSYIDMVIDGHNDSNVWQNIELGKDYKTIFDYNIDIPFMLDAGSTFTYDESRTGLYEKAFQYFSAEEVYINSTFINRYPADIAFMLTLYDRDGNELNDIEVTVPDIVKASPSTEVTPDVIPAETYMKIKLREKVPHQINKIDKMEWHMRTIFNSSASITEYQNINVQFVLDAPNGIDIVN